MAQCSTLFSYRDGDMYAALRDCRRAVEMDRTYVKAHLRFILVFLYRDGSRAKPSTRIVIISRMMRCYLELDLANKSQSYMQWFHEKFSEESTSTHCVALEDDICRKLRNEGKPGDSIGQARNVTHALPSLVYRHVAFSP